tara:strand:- start:820 stop:1680 length:861 start_codon:yes stop_codon:yes gene_type:complete
MKKDVSRDISYSSSAQSLAGRALIRSIENVTGRIGLIKRAANYDLEVASGKDFWEVIVNRYDLELDLISGSLKNINKSGPIVVVSNHPYGILDGLIMGYILSKTRGDFRILAHRVFKRAKDLDDVILPISFDEDKEAAKQNINTRKEALNYLKNGGCIGIFPGGTVSTSLKPFGKALDPSWRNFTAKLIAKSGANVIPIFFQGSNSRLFQIASHLHYNLRVGLMINEFRRKIDNKVKVAIGENLPLEQIKLRNNDPNGMMNYLRDQTYELSPEKNYYKEFGFDFEI